MNSIIYHHKSYNLFLYIRHLRYSNNIVGFSIDNKNLGYCTFNEVRYSYSFMFNNMFKVMSKLHNLGRFKITWYKLGTLRKISTRARTHQPEVTLYLLDRIIRRVPQ